MDTSEARQKTNKLSTRMRKINYLMMKKDQKQKLEKKFREDETKVINSFPRVDTA